MANVVVTNAPSAAVLYVAPTQHPGAKYAKTYKILGVRNNKIMALRQFLLT